MTHSCGGWEGCGGGGCGCSGCRDGCGWCAFSVDGGRRFTSWNELNIWSENMEYIIYFYLELL